MNKYVFSLAVLIQFATTGWSQNRAVLLQESFDGNTIPAGWSVQGEGANNWVVSTTNHTGGSPNEMQLYCSPNFNGMARLVTPAINLGQCPKGLYFLKATNEGHEITTKLTIQ